MDNYKLFNEDNYNFRYNFKIISKLFYQLIMNEIKTENEVEFKKISKKDKIKGRKFFEEKILGKFTQLINKEK